MSVYGRVWEEIAEVRREIKKLVPNADTNSLAAAERSVEDYANKLIARLHKLVKRWRTLEGRADEPD